MKGEMKSMKKLQYVILTLILAVLFVGCSSQGKEAKTFAEWSEYEVFADVPALITDNTRISEAHDAGGENYIIEVSNVEKKDYDDYLELLTKKGFEKYVDNGEKGIDGKVFTANYTKKDLVLTVNYIENIHKVYISASENQELSEHLLYKEEYVSDNVKGRKTTLSMLEMYDFGNSFVIQLKNGHFIVCDGGVQEDMIYLIEYLEKLTPEGQKPVVDAWFISHAHLDHIGCFIEVAKHLEYVKRLSVEGFYFSQPNDTVCRLNGDASNVNSFLLASKIFKNTEGKTTPMYRTHTGQRYYFNDINIEIVFGQEIFEVENSYAKVFNDTSTWMMLNIEGQKVLMPGDADALTQSVVVDMYSKEYLSVDILQAFHHGYNVYDAVSDHFSFKTVIYPFFATENERWRSEIKEGNQLVQEAATEYFSHAEGTKVLTFPYEIGSVETEPLQTWSHHPDRKPSEGVK